MRTAWDHLRLFLGRERLTREVRRAMNRLQALDQAGRYIALAVVAEELEEAFAERYGLKPSRGVAHRCAHALVGGRTRGCFGMRECQPPKADHLELWKAGRQAVALVSHPYIDFSEEDARQQSEWCHRYGLTWGVGDASWYYPGATTTVVYTRADYTLSDRWEELHPWPRSEEGAA